MLKKSIKVLALAGVVALVPSLASAYSGMLVSCTGSGTPAPVIVTLSPGLTCTNTLNAITVKATAKTGNALNGCGANAGAPWATWATGKWNKLGAAGAALIAQAEVKIAAKTFGNCILTPDPTALDASPSGVGTIAFLDASGNKVAKSVLYGKVTGVINPATSSGAAQVVGIVTAGLGLGGEVVVTVPINLATPTDLLSMSTMLGCNLNPIFCSADPFTPKGMASCKGKPSDPACCAASACIPPANKLDLQTGPGALLTVAYPDITLCTDLHTPYYCCTGVGVGSC